MKKRVEYMKNEFLIWFKQDKYVLFITILLFVLLIIFRIYAA